MGSSKVLIVMAILALLPLIASCGKESKKVVAPVPASRWAAMESGTTQFLRAVWGSSATNVFAVGDSGTVLHYDGQLWSRTRIAADLRLTDVWGASGTDVFVTSSDDSIYHFDGRAWGVAALTGLQSFTSVWGTSGTDVFVGTLFGGVVYFNGNGWYWIRDEEPYFIHTKVWGTATNNVYITRSNEVERFDGMKWLFTTVAPSFYPTNYQDPAGGIGGTSPSDVYVVGGSTVLRFNGTRWDSVTVPPLGFSTTQSLYDVWGTTANDVWFVGDKGALLHKVGPTVALEESGVVGSLRGIWGSSSSNIFVVGEGGVILHYGPD